MTEQLRTAMFLQDNTRFRKQYETDRLILKILDEPAADEVLNFLNRGANVFEEYESDKSSDYYTSKTQRRLLHMEYNMAKQRSGVRFWIYRKENPHEIIGTVSFSFYKTAPFQSIMIGYKLLPEYWHMGYATEAIKACQLLVHQVMAVHRIEAYVLPENKASQTLLSRLGYSFEGTAYSCIEVKGVWRDHLIYSYTY